MSRIAYEAWDPRGEALAIVDRANAICAEYRQQGYDLTLRQLYYQFVARAIIPNNDKSYKRLGSIVNKGRMAGLIDWSYIVDRTRNLRSVSHWGTPGDILQSAAQSFRLDKWSSQPARVEVWVEKEALAGIVGSVCDSLDVPWFSCRGYVSQSELWGAGRRLGRYIEGGQRVVVLHLGDHDPSGIDMTRDITDRLSLFIATDYHGSLIGPDPYGYDDEKHWEAWRYASAIDDMLTDYGYDLDRRNETREGWEEGRDVLEVRRIALNLDQIRQYNPPPNPAKITDSRAASYIREFGRESWELDALEPSVLDALITRHVLGERVDELWDVREGEEEGHRTLLDQLSDRWIDVREWLNEQEGTDA